MRLVIISDTHGLHESITLGGGQVLIHCGDICGNSDKASVRNFADWFAAQDFEHKIVIAGNHDKYIKASRFDLDSRIHYLQDSSVTIDGFKFYGMPWTPTFFNWFWMKDRGPNMLEVTDLIPNDTNVLITHGPAFNQLDETEEGLNVGCEQLRRKITSLDNLRVHCFGHIHEAYGQSDVLKGGIYSHQAINASLVNRSYKMVNAPVVVDL